MIQRTYVLTALGITPFLVTVELPGAALQVAEPLVGVLLWERDQISVCTPVLNSVQVVPGCRLQETSDSGLDIQFASVQCSTQSYSVSLTDPAPIQCFVAVWSCRFTLSVSELQRLARVKFSVCSHTLSFRFDEGSMFTNYIVRFISTNGSPNFPISFIRACGMLMPQYHSTLRELTDILGRPRYPCPVSNVQEVRPWCLGLGRREGACS